MDCCIQNEEKKEKYSVSRAIDRQIQRDKGKKDKEISCLILGPGDAGKSTILKQMKILHLDGYSTLAERLEFRPIIYNNIIASMKELIRCTKIYVEAAKNSPDQQKKKHRSKHNKKNSAPTTDENLIAFKGIDKGMVKLIETFGYTFSTGCSPMGPELGGVLQALWKDFAVKEAFNNYSASILHLDSSAKYFLDALDRISKDDYIPTVEDVLRARLKTNGAYEVTFTFKKANFRVIDVGGGQRTKRKKWIHHFEDVDSLIYCAALDEYDKTLDEASEVNRMEESLMLFKSIINCEFFNTMNIILFLNKYDLFQEKVTKVDLKVCFPKYKGGKNLSKATQFITRRFLSMDEHPQERKIYVHQTTATDTNNIKFVWHAVADMILSRILSSVGMIDPT